ncbi:MAG: ABC transporter substrate-binding protein, partial [Chloroflexota bacterium]
YFIPPEKPVAEPIYVAFVSGFSGESGAISQEMQNVAQLSWDALNSRGGINGHPVEMLVYDDQDDPAKAAEVARQIVAEDKVLAVIGHGTSETCLAAGPIYAKAKILTVSSVCTSDVVTRDNEWYFRSTYDNRYQGLGIASYLEDILEARDVLMVVTNSLDNDNLADNIERYYQNGTLTRIDIADSSDAARLTAMDRLWELSTPESTVVLAADDAAAEKIIVAMRNRGMRNQIIGSDNLGTQSFLNRFRKTPQEAANPGYYSDGIIAAAPMVVDSLSGDALEALRFYRSVYGTEVDWQAATTYDATYAIRDALKLANVNGDPANRHEERQAARDAIDQMDSAATASTGVLGPILFDDDGTMPRYPVFAVASNGSFVSAPVQIHVYDPVSDLTLQEDLSSGKAFVVGSTLMQRQHIVFTGLNFNEVSDLDLSNPSFYADFFIWFTYVGDDSATNIVFQNAVNPSLSLGDPIRESITPDGMKYRLYRVSGRFKAPLEFQDFPFDVQNLVIVFQNTVFPSSELVYAV